MICKQCNFENPDGAEFCSNCGTVLAANDQPQSNLQQPVSQSQQTEVKQTPYQIQSPVVSNASQSAPSNGLSVAALVCGILGIVGSFIPIVKYFTLVLAILGIVFGVLGKKKAMETGHTNTGLATAGLVLGIIGTAFSAVGVICALACAGAATAATGGALDQIL